MAVVPRTKSSIDLYIKNNFLTKQEAHALWEECLDLDFEVNPKIMIMGKEASTHRLLAFFSDSSEGYQYSGQITKAQPLTPGLTAILKRVNSALNSSYNGILINVYEDGSSYIGSHSDNERDLDKDVGVAMISLGASRKFRIRSRDKEVNGFTDYPTGDGQLMVMPKGFQQLYKHEIPVEKLVKEMRISLTFRCHQRDRT